VNHKNAARPHQRLKKERALCETVEWIVISDVTLPGSQHRHTEDRVEPVEPAKDAVTGIDEADSFASVPPRFQQVEGIDVGADNLGGGEIPGERDTLLTGGTAKG
jgi:hypothetical protein